MVLLVILFPQMVTVGLDKVKEVDVTTIEYVLPETNYDEPAEEPGRPRREPSNRGNGR